MSSKPTYEDLQKRITDLESALQRKQSDADLEQIFLMSLDMICIADIRTATFLKVNPAFTETLGYSEEELLTSSFLEFIHPDDIEATRHVVLEKLLNGDKVINFENRYRCKDGSYKWLSWVSHPRPDKGVTYGVARDITEKKRIDAALAYSEKKWRHILVNTPQIGVSLDTNARITFANAHLLKLTGWKEDEILGKDWFSLFIPESQRDEVRKVFLTIMNSETPPLYTTNENEILTKNGELRNVAWSNVLTFGPEGEIVDVTCLGIDLTERIIAERVLNQTQKMESISTLAGGIAHDFNNMLGVLMGNLSYALSIMRDDDDLYEILVDAMEGAKAAQALTRQLLTFARGGDPIKRTCHLNTLIQKTAQFVTRGTSSKCRFDLAEDLWPVDIDEGQVNQAVSNIILNASQAMPEGGIITIRTQNREVRPENPMSLPAGRYAYLSIEDEGIGMPEKLVPHIFDPFFSTKQKGNGLGLATTYSIVKRHHGHIMVDSHPGRGSIFNILLPSSECPFMEEQAHPVVGHRGRGKILIMDDQESVLKMIGRMLTSMGYDRVFASDGAQAVEIFKTAYNSDDPFDLVILDLTVPGGMGGVKTVQELLKIDPTVKAVVSSGYSNDPVMANFQDYGFSGVVSKPYTREELARTLDRLL
ncbi:MAG: PAS domain S-box protein [Thermodesulfobacteriota bacterium]|nr:PAS domain S-box protein [Thermodesulfobacteriota bacterium]